MKLFKFKNGKGIVSISTIVIVLLAMLFTAMWYNRNYSSLTGNVVYAEGNFVFSRPVISYVNDINELKILNEGWYEIRHGYVFYLEHFDNSIPLYIKVLNLNQQDGIVVVDADGTVSFDESFRGLP